MLLSEIIEKIIADKKLSKTEISKRSGISLGYITDITKKRAIPSPEKFVAILKALDVNLAEMKDLTLTYFVTNPLKIEKTEKLIFSDPQLVKTLLSPIRIKETYKYKECEINDINDLVDLISDNDLLLEFAKNIMGMPGGGIYKHVSSVSNIAHEIYQSNYKNTLNPDTFNLLIELLNCSDIISLKIEHLPFHGGLEGIINEPIMGFSFRINPDDIPYLKKVILSFEQKKESLFKQIESVINIYPEPKQEYVINLLSEVIDSFKGMIDLKDSD